MSILWQRDETVKKKKNYTFGLHLDVHYKTEVHYKNESCRGLILEGAFPLKFRNLLELSRIKSNRCTRTLTYHCCLTVLHKDELHMMRMRKFSLFTQSAYAN